MQWWAILLITGICLYASADILRHALDWYDKRRAGNLVTITTKSGTQIVIKRDDAISARDCVKEVERWMKIQGHIAGFHAVDGRIVIVRAEDIDTVDVT